MQADFIYVTEAVTGYRHLRRQDSHLAKGIKKNKEGERRIKGIVMAQWVNCLWNNIFANPLPLSLSCEISKALHQVLLQAGWLAGWQADEIQVNFEIFKIGNILHLTKIQHYNSLANPLQRVFSNKTYCKVDFKHEISGS